MKKILIIFTSLVLLGSACAPAGQPTEAPSIPDEDPTPTRIPVDLSPAQRAAITALSGTSSLSADKIKVVSTEAVDWPDGCLGVYDEGLVCAQVVTPGFRVILEAGVKQVEYRTNQDGTQIRPASVALTWKREGGIAGFCNHMTVYLSGEVHGSSCKGDQYVEGRLTDLTLAEDAARFDGWLAAYGQVEIDASDPRGVSDRMVVELTFSGLGRDQALTSSEQKQLLEFARSLYQQLYK